MTAELLPLFPLSQPLLPKAALPLHIFEARYIDLLAAVTGDDGDNRFGVVALSAGSEVANPLVDQIARFADIGTVAEIVRIEPAEPESPGRSANVLALGRRRFRIRRIVDGATPYLRAEVDYLREAVGAVPDGLPDAARALVAEYTDLLLQLTGAELDGRPRRYPKDPVALSYRLAAEAALLPSEKQELLVAHSAADRLQLLVRLLRREITLVRRTRSVAVAPAILQAALRAD